MLDQDPLTGEQVTVSSVSQGAGGSPIVIIDTQLPGNFLRATYEQSSGMLVQFTLQQASSGTTTSVRLVQHR